MARTCPVDSARDDRKTAAYEAGVTFKHGAAIVRDAEGVKDVLRRPGPLQDALDAAAMKQMAPDEIPLIFLDGKMHATGASRSPTSSRGDRSRRSLSR